MGRLSRREFLRRSAALAATGAAASLWVPDAVRREAWAQTRDTVAVPQGTTYERSIVPGPRDPYARLRYRPGWPLVVREDLGAVGRRNRELRRVALGSVLHLTDIQIPDAQSPARLEWLSRFPGIREAWRPHETVVNHISEAAVAQSRLVGRGPVTGRSYDAAVSTGDNIDNMQENELRWFFALLDGGPLEPNSGDPARYEGVQEYWRHEDLPHPGGYDDFYWRPDEPPEGFFPDVFKRDHGYPTLNGFLDAAVEPFVAQGLGAPWYSMYGNHDGLVQGNAAPNPLFEAIATGAIFPGPVGPKFVGFPPGYDWTPQDAVRFFGDLLAGQVAPDQLLAAPARLVTDDEQRRFVGPYEYVRAHWEWTTGQPRGHGYSEDNLGDGATQEERDATTTLYYTFRPVDGMPLLGVAIDTTNRLGGASGSIGQRQYEWLEQQLQAVSSRWYDASGRAQRGRADDHLVVVFGHHNLETMDNLLPSPDDPVRVPGEQVEALLHRYPNVIAFVNGHSHMNRIWARPDPSARSQGFWEISTSAQLDYPMQTRVVEIVDNRDRTLSIFTSLVDQAGPADAREVFGSPGPGYELLELASYGRELAYNDFRDHREVGDPFDFRAGGAKDRNVELLIAAPFNVRSTGPPDRARARSRRHAGAGAAPGRP